MTSIRARLLFTLIPSVLAPLVIFAWLGLSVSEKTLIDQVQQNARELTELNARDFDTLFESSQKVADGLAVFVGAKDYLIKEGIDLLVKRTVEANPEIYGATVALVPNATRLGKFSPYYYHDASGIKFVSLAEQAYEYTKWDWFKRPLATGHGYWTEPYVDRNGGDAPMVTYSSPIRRGGKLIGVATVDFSLESLIRRTQSIKIGKRGFAYLVTPGATLLAHPDKAHDNDPFKGDQAWKTTSRIKSTAWSLVAVFPLNEILAPISTVKQQTLFIAVLLIGFVSVLILFFSKTITSPITRLVELTGRYGQGFLNERLDIASGPKEIRRLSEAFNSMGQRIEEGIETERRMTAQKERYQQELLIAADIQQSILPKTFPPFPKLTGRIDIYAFTKPATEVGGDYYDFFEIPEGRIGFCIADVSGKGAPSSLFMAMTRVLIREMGQSGLPPAEVLRRVNHLLSADNDASMFVTALYGEYDPITGKIRIANAGHNWPLHVSNEGQCREISVKSDLPLGAMPATHYHMTELTLNPGDSILLYTDGVTEAENSSEESFGMARLINSIKGTGDCRTLLDGVLASIQAHASGRSQHDDITMLMLKRKAGSPREATDGTESNPTYDGNRSLRLDLPARLETIETLTPVIEGCAQQLGFDDKAIGHLVLSVEELVTNVVMHAYAGESNERFRIEIAPRVRENRTDIKVVVIDYGKPFDFDSASRQYDGNASVEQPLGGIGLFLVQKFMDEVRYEPSTFEGNKTTIILTRKP